MALKRVRFAIEEEDCERCSQLGRKLKEQGRTLDTALRQQGMSEAQLKACNEEKAELAGKCATLEAQLAAARAEVDELTEQLRAARSSKRQRLDSAAQAHGEQVKSLTQQLATCRAELAKLQEAEKRRSSGGSHAAGKQTPQQLQVQAPPEAGGPPAGGAAEAGAAPATEFAAAEQEPDNAAPADTSGPGAGGAALSSLGTTDAAGVLEQLQAGGAVAPPPVQQRRQAASSDPSAGQTQPPQGED